MTASLDRFEGNVAVFEDRDSGAAILLDRDALPPDAAVGILARIDLGPPPRLVDVLAEETRAKKDELQAKRDRLRARRGGRD